MWLERRYVPCPHCPSCESCRKRPCRCNMSKDVLDELREATDLHGRLIQAYNLLPWSFTRLKEQLQEDIDTQGAKVLDLQKSIRERLKSD